MNTSELGCNVRDLGRLELSVKLKTADDAGDENKQLEDGCRAESYKTQGQLEGITEYDCKGK